MVTAVKGRKAPTEAQKAQATERRTKMRELAKTISAMTEAERAAIVARAGAVVTIEGRKLSIFNTCFALQQSDTVSVVGGFQQWRRAGRSVRKGEHGIAIWVPLGTRAEPTGADLDDDGKRPSFILGTVFDVSQTDEVSADDD